MGSIVRRAGSKLLSILKRAADPGGTANYVKVYGKDTAGVTELFAQNGAGTVFQLTPGAAAAGRELLPENWQQQDVPANQAATAMGAGVSQLFDDIQMIRAGSLIGVNLRFNAVLTAGNATAVVTVNGVATALTVNVASPNADGRATAVPETITYAAGDKIGVTLATSAGFLPVTLDAEVTVEVDAT